MRTVVGPVTVRHAGEVVESETTATAVGPNVVVLSTAVPGLGVVVTTTYTGADDADTTAVDLVIGPRPSASNRPRTIPRGTVPVTHAREECLLDHARQVMIALKIHGRAAYCVDISDDAVASASAL